MYNLDSIEEIAGGDQAFIQDIVATFLIEIPPDLEAMKMAIANNNRRMAYQFAHKMKPNIEMFGIDLLSQITQMEKWSKSQKPVTAIEGALEEISNTLHSVMNQLRVDFNC